MPAREYMFLSDFEFQETQKQTSQNTKRRRKPRPDRSILPLPNSFSPRQRYWRYPISRIVLTRSEVRSCYTPRPMRGSARSGGVTLASLFWRTCSSSSHRVAGYYRSRECARLPKRYCPAPHQTAHSWWLSPARTYVGVFSSEDGFIIPCFLFRVWKSGKYF